MAKDKINLLHIIPYISEHITTEKEGELSVIAFPRFRSKFMMKYFVPKRKSPMIRVRLEEHGTAVWDLLDGERTVQQIIDLLADHFGNEENYGYRITTYLAQLQKNGFVKYRIPAD
jgi:Coenzyme PQQ synthesis protein D (PqqD).